MYIETSGNNSVSDMVFCSFELTDIIQNSNKSFYHNRFSSSDPNLWAMGRFRIHLLLNDNTWSTRYNTNNIDRYSDSSTQGISISLKFTVKNMVLNYFTTKLTLPMLIYDSVLLQ